MTKEYSRQWRLDLKVEVLTHYGNGKLACVRCGYSNIPALSIDHINQADKTTSTSGDHLYRFLRNSGYPQGYQTLCMNCQWLKQHEEGESRNQFEKVSRGHRRCKPRVYGGTGRPRLLKNLANRTVVFDKYQDDQLRTIAHREGISVSDLIRRLLFPKPELRADGLWQRLRRVFKRK